jgi:hypothetical protein
MNDISSIVSQFDPRLAAVLGWIILMSKMGIDWLRTAATLPKWAPPAICFGSTTVLILLVMLALGIPATMQLVAQGVLLAIIGTAIAIGSTALQSRTNPSTDTTTATAIVDEIQERIREQETIGVQDAPHENIVRGMERARMGQTTRPTETAL